MLYPSAEQSDMPVPQREIQREEPTWSAAKRGGDGCKLLSNTSHSPGFSGSGGGAAVHFLFFFCNCTKRIQVSRQMGGLGSLG